MNPRSIRRAAERQALKQPRQLSQPAVSPSFADALCAQLDGIKAAAKSRMSEARAAVNRANAQHSTGPTSLEGKAISCLNNTKFGLIGARFTVLAWEDRAAFDQLLSDLRREHQPSTPTEKILIEDMAQHHWLKQRAILLQNLCFDIDEPACESSTRQQQLALYMRYETTHRRAFHKCLDQLLKIRAARQKEAHGFESQQQKQSGEVRKQETHQIRVRIAKAHAVHLEMRNTTQTAPSAEPKHAVATAQAVALVLCPANS
jgi:hypothetical protein